MQKLTVSIVTYNTDTDELSRCLNALSSYPVSIYVVDNSSKGYISDFCAKYANIQYIANVNSGYGAGHNIAIRKAIASGAKYHLVLNSDVYFDDSVIGKIIDYMERNEDVAQVQPNIIYPDGSMQYSCRLLPSPVDLFFRRFMPDCLTRKMNDRYMLRFDRHEREMNVPYHQGSFMFFRLECFEKVGLFDERFFMYPEDIDITRRMHKYYRTMFFPGATVVHAHRAASYKSFRMLLVHTVNMIKYFNKWGWIFDSERRKWNRDLLKELGYKK